MPSPMHCSEVSAALEREGLSALPAATLAHVAECDNCQGYLSDLNSIVDAAHQLPAEVEPPARIWIALQAQLSAEGIIHELPAVLAPAQTAPWWHGLFQGRALATAAVGVLIMAAGIAQLRKPVVSAPAGTAAQTEQAPDALAVSGAALNVQENDLRKVQDQRKMQDLRKVQDLRKGKDLRSVQTAGTLPSAPPSSAVDASLQQDLLTLDAFIAECEQHLKANPRDQLAREYLAGAYQQKAELLAEMMDRGRSVN
jgi:ribosomal protein S15P/S13E